jgi:hypothetical protein
MSWRVTMRARICPHSQLTSTDKVPVLIIRRELLKYTGLDDIYPGRKVDLR